MKKRERKIVTLILFILSSILIINLVSATDVVLSKTEYYPGETIQADIFGSFSGGLAKEKLILCRGNEVNPIAVSSDLVQLQDKFLFYAITGSSLIPGDYYLKIKSSTTPSCLSGIAFSKPLKIIAPTDRPSIQVNPAFIISESEGEISFKIKGFNAFQKIDANFAATGETNNFTLPEQGEKTLYFSTANLYGNIESSVKVNEYTVPVYLSLPPAPENKSEVAENNTINQTVENDIILQDEIKFSPESMSLLVLNNTDYEVNFSVINLGNQTMTNLDLYIGSGEISLSESFIAELLPHNTTKISINFKLSNSLKTNITLAYKNQSITLPILINLTKNPSEVNVETNLLDVNPASFDLEINFSKEYKFNFTIENKGNKTVEDITLSCKNEKIKLDKTSISSIKPGKNTTVSFEVNTNETINSEIEINYDNETIILPISFKELEVEEYILSDNLVFYPEEIKGKFFSDKDYVLSIILANVGEKDLENIIISCEDKNLEFTPTKIDLLKSYKKTYVNLTINLEEDSNLSLTAEWNGQSISLPIKVIIITDESEEQIDTGDYTFKTCTEREGITCKKGEKCIGNLDTDIRLLNCCYGKCEIESSSTQWIIGIVLLIVLGIAGFYFYSRYKSSKSASSDQIMKNRAKDFETRMNPKEVRGSLSKI